MGMLPRILAIIVAIIAILVVVGFIGKLLKLAISLAVIVGIGAAVWFFVKKKA